MVGWMLLLAGTARADGLDRLSVSLGLAGVGGAPRTAGALGSAGVSVRATERLYVDLGGRTGLLGGPLREVTGISLGGRAALTDALFFRADLVHQHETPWGDFAAEPLLHAIGSGDGIGHRTGLDAGLGLRGSLPAVHTSGVHVGAAALATWFPDAHGPKLYGVLEAQLTLDLGRRQADDEAP